MVAYQPAGWYSIYCCIPLHLTQLAVAVLILVMIHAVLIHIIPACTTTVVGVRYILNHMVPLVPTAGTAVPPIPTSIHSTSSRIPR